jgi:hypothetical protein
MPVKAVQKSGYHLAVLLILLAGCPAQARRQAAAWLENYEEGVTGKVSKNCN